MLEKLGYETFLVAGEITCVPVPNNHALTIVKLKNGANAENIYLIDIGNAKPIAGPINLSELPLRTVEGGYDIEYRFNTAANRYERILLNGCPLKGAVVSFAINF